MDYFKVLNQQRDTNNASSCEALGLQCQNGAFIAYSEEGQCDSAIDTQCLPWSFPKHLGCTCTPGYSGLECSIETPQRCRSQDGKQQWDGSFQNAHTMECTVGNDTNSAFLGLKGNSVSVEMQDEQKNIQFTFKSQVSIDGKCSNVLPIVACNMSECNAASTQKNDRQFQCSKHVCSTCLENECKQYSEITTMVNEDSSPITIILNNINESNGTASGYLMMQTALIDVNLPLLCQTGQCVSNDVNNTAIAAHLSGNRLLAIDAGLVTSITCSGAFVIISLLSVLLMLFTYKLPRQDQSTNLNYLHEEENMVSELEATQILTRHSMLNPHYIGEHEPDSTSSDEDMVTITSRAIDHVDSRHQALPSLIYNETKSSNTMHQRGMNRSQTATSVALKFVPNTEPCAMSLNSSMNGAGIVFRGLSVCYNGGSEQRHVLKAVSGYVTPGQLLGIMGPSGSGKTSLMRLVAGPKWLSRNGSYDGKVSLLRERNDDKSATKCSHIAFVQQHEMLLPTQTVRECLLFSAKLRCSDGTCPLDVSISVDNILKLLGIHELADLPIGSPENGGLSGGERRRVTIGIELVNSPSILLLDEPLSGLDSNSASSCLRALHDVSRSGVGCMLTIHQPSTRLFEMFDQILLLTKSGNVAYFGSPLEVQRHFREIRYNQPSILSTPEFMLKVASLDSECEQNDIAALFASSAAGQNLDKRISELQCQASRQPHLLASPKFEVQQDKFIMLLPFSQIYDNNYWQALPNVRRNVITQLHLLTSRRLCCTMRNPALIYVHYITTLAVALLFGGVFWQLDNSIPGVQNRMGYLFFSCVYFCLTSMSSLAIFISNRAVLRQEVASGFYSAAPYFFSQVLPDLFLLRIVPPVLFGIVSYFMVGLQLHGLKYIIYLITLVLISTTATALCMVVSIASNQIEHANFIAIIVLLYCIMFGGLFVNNSTGSTELSRLNYSSFIRAGFEALIDNEFMGISLLFNPTGFPSVQLTGSVFVMEYGMNTARMSTDIWILFAFFLGFILIAFLIAQIRIRCYI